MKREHIFTILLAVLVVIALFQTFQLTGLKGKITSNAVQDLPLPDGPSQGLPELEGVSNNSEKPVE